jgi:hypothetical protein
MSSVTQDNDRGHVLSIRVESGSRVKVYRAWCVTVD